MLKICTFNIKNNYDDYDKSKSNEINKFINNNKIDILCLQELFDKCDSDLNEYLENTNYNSFGNYRFKLKLLKKFNESTKIITNQKVLKHSTYHLPFLPSTIKRIVTKVIIDTKEYGEIVIINTHLDFKYEFVKKRQLKILLKILNKEKRPIILTGDFNIKINNQIFKDFIENLKKINMYRVVLNDKTLKQSKSHYAIDHIFLSNEFKVVKKEIIKDLEISDHYPLLITIGV